MDELRSSIGYSELLNIWILSRPLLLKLYCYPHTQLLTIIFRRWMELPTLRSHYDDWNGRYRCLCPLSPQETWFRGTYYTDTHIKPLRSCLHSIQIPVPPRHRIPFVYSFSVVPLTGPARSCSTSIFLSVLCIAVPLTHKPNNYSYRIFCPLAGPQCGSPGTLKIVDSCKLSKCHGNSLPRLLP